jgi:hypothetical protein
MILCSKEPDIGDLVAVMDGLETERIFVRGRVVSMRRGTPPNMVLYVRVRTFYHPADRFWAGRTTGEAFEEEWIFGREFECFWIREDPDAVQGAV